MSLRKYEKRYIGPTDTSVIKIDARILRPEEIGTGLNLVRKFWRNQRLFHAM